MSENVDRIVIFPRYTTFVGSTAVVSQVIDVRRWMTANFSGWEGTGLGLIPSTLQFTLQVSADLENWFDAGTFPGSPGPGEFSASQGLVYPWMRVKATVSGADPVVSAWLVAEMVRRKTAGAEEAA